MRRAVRFLAELAPARADRGRCGAEGDRPGHGDERGPAGHQDRDEDRRHGRRHGAHRGPRLSGPTRGG